VKQYDCGHRVILYNSCTNRNCPKCQAAARAKWLAEREAELLPVEAYFHVVFTLPQEIARLALQNARAIYRILFRAASETLLSIAADPKHLGAEIGFLAVLHTWGRNRVIPAGGLSPDHARWVPSRYCFFLPVKVLGRVFRGKFVAALKRAFTDGELTFHGKLSFLAQPKAFSAWLRPLFRHDWVVYSKRPFGGPEHALRYLGGYTHRVAISNHRLVAFADERVSFGETLRIKTRSGS
jgi:hypothetical protein